MANESAYERRRREASDVVAEHNFLEEKVGYEYDPEWDLFTPKQEMPTTSKYKEMGITSMINAVHSALSSLEHNCGRLNETLTPILSDIPANMESSDPQPNPESGIAKELWAVMRRIQSLDNFVAQIKHRVDL